MDDTRGLRITEYFRARLAEEVRRAERYGRPFAVAYLTCGELSARQAFNTLRPYLRCTDLVEVIRGRHPAPGDSDFGEATDQVAKEMEDRVAVILPETDRAKARALLGRLRENLADLPSLKVGVAVFPDDATNPQDLLVKAAAAAGEVFHT